MGAADIVPGVSGGTVAFITGIYPRLLHALRSFDLAVLRLLLRGDVRGAWQHVDGAFLFSLLAGILTSVFTLARLISWLLYTYPEPLWSLFFGLILASALLLFGQIGAREKRHWAMLALGFGIALYVSVAPGGSFIDGELGVFLAGFIAICAMILPGISGSFILVLLGMYSVVLTAVKELDIVLILILATGAGCGLLCFSRLLYWLLSRFRDLTIALLTGFLFGSLAMVWPWKRVAGWMLDRHGEMRAVQQLPVLPQEYLARTGDDPMVIACVVMAFVGFFCVWFVDHRWGKLKVEIE